MRTAKGKSDDLPYSGPVVPVPDLGPDPLDEHGEPVTRCAYSAAALAATASPSTATRSGSIAAAKVHSMTDDRRMR